MLQTSVLAVDEDYIHPVYPATYGHVFVAFYFITDCSRVSSARLIIVFTPIKFSSQWNGYEYIDMKGGESQFMRTLFWTNIYNILLNCVDFLKTYWGENTMVAFSRMTFSYAYS